MVRKRIWSTSKDSLFHSSSPGWIFFQYFLSLIKEKNVFVMGLKEKDAQDFFREEKDHYQQSFTLRPSGKSSRVFSLKTRVRFSS